MLNCIEMQKPLPKPHLALVILLHCFKFVGNIREYTGIHREYIGKISGIYGNISGIYGNIQEYTGIYREYTGICREYTGIYSTGCLESVLQYYIV